MSPPHLKYEYKENREDAYRASKDFNFLNNEPKLEIENLDDTMPRQTEKR